MEMLGEMKASQKKKKNGCHPRKNGRQPSRNESPARKDGGKVGRQDKGHKNQLSQERS
jgi:hypothetical protein